MGSDAVMKSCSHWGMFQVPPKRRESDTPKTMKVIRYKKQPELDMSV